MTPTTQRVVTDRRAFPTLLLFTSLFFFSGFAGLIYEVVWERILQMFFGVTSLSVTLIVSAYMLGLGLGSLIGGRLSQVIRRPSPPVIVPAHDEARVLAGVE